MKPLSIVLLVVALLSSCTSLRSIEIDTYSPAAITFPPEIKTVMIVNNSAQQPDGVGHGYIRNISNTPASFAMRERIDSTLSVSSDSTAYTFCLSLGRRIAESPLFSDVRICEDTLRLDSAFYDVKPFSARRLSEMCEEYGVDALISLDKIFFNTVFSETGLRGFALDNSVEVRMSGELRALWPGQEHVYSIPFVDSLTWYWNENLSFEDFLVGLSINDVRPAMLSLSEAAGQGAYVNFVPHWSNDKRWYYTSISSEWRRGTAFAVANKWAEAAVVWEPLLHKTTNLKQQARLASNLALCYEMTGQLDKAVLYAAMSHLYYEELSGADDSSTKLQKLYLGVLQTRVEADKLVSTQLREATR